MFTYKQIKDLLDGGISNSQVMRSDGATIPFDPANRDAEEFALWLKSGNVPEPAEENSTVDAQWIADTIAKLLPNA
jgi:hypothetical protein